jgi:RNA polymerase sigma-B factor
MTNESRREETRLFIELRRRGDPLLREAIVRRYLPLARHTARRFHRNGGPLEDLFQVASFALVKAVDGFDPERGLAFSSYAIPTMTGELKRYARDTGWGMRVPRGLQERVLDVDRTVAGLTGRLGRSPTPAEVADATGLTSEQVLEALEAASNHVVESLDTPLGLEGDSITRIDTLGAPDRRFELVDDTLSVAPAVGALPERERKILSLRFGDELPQSEIASRLGISQMHVSRLLRRTLNALAEHVERPPQPASAARGRAVEHA